MAEMVLERGTEASQVEAVLERGDEASQVEAVLEREASLTEVYRQHVATREDVQAVRTELVGVQAALQLEIASARSDLKLEMAGFKSDLQADISGVKSDLRWMKWLLGVVAAGVLIPLLRDLFGMLP